MIFILKTGGGGTPVSNMANGSVKIIHVVNQTNSLGIDHTIWCVYVPLF